jgi:serine/threonine-protein kinase
MAPEVLRGRAHNQQSDIYSVAAVAYTLLAGHSPIEEENLTNAISAAISGSIPELPQTVPAPLRLIVHKGMERNPEDRHASAPEMAAELNQLRAMLL